ncbi:MAG: hypothetical protein V1726_05810 [Methanobacteriota archaeon]
MSFIFGMDPVVFTAWIGTILAAILCIVYGVYYQFLKKTDEKPVPKRPTKKDQETEEGE